MHTISHIYEGYFESKGSKFFSFLIPISRFDSYLDELKKSHPKAVHFVYATRIQKIQIIESFSDDGEPKGSSGIPTLNVLRGENLIDIGLVIVRYFGGTLLGVGGLVRAYTQSAQSAIQTAKNENGFLPFTQSQEYKLLTSYSHFSQVQYWLERLEITMIQKDFGTESVELWIQTTQEKRDELAKNCGTKVRFL